MQRVGCKPDDPMYVAAWDAHEALQALTSTPTGELHPRAAGKRNRSGRLGCDFDSGPEGGRYDEPTS